uniref:Thiamin pyrophosphokinase 1-like n=1 Tax=Dermatophagoides pteronyssinus TaxID=6956 RepID=A0A6P6XPY0_DERPT|nr:thiamin pyrophosphokinase 1-like [Dermatophagoides pteronyssinus]
MATIDQEILDFDWENCIEIIKSHGKGKNFAVMLLNHCFDTILSKFASMEQFFETEKFQNFQQIWNNCFVRMTVDGGTNSLYNMQQSNGNLFDPTFITGDFDSIQSKVMDHFKQCDGKIKILHTPDQNHTDFEKALFILDEQVLNSVNIAATNTALDCILVFFSNSGRIDQYLSILSTVHNFTNNREKFPPIILVDMVDSISFVLKKGSHRISKISNSKWCSLIPLCGPVKIKTIGLHWNLDKNSMLEFGKFISSSNEFDQNNNTVMVDVDEKPVLFSTEFHL